MRPGVPHPSNRVKGTWALPAVKSKREPKQIVSADEILAVALVHAEAVGWESIRLHQIAAEIGIPLSAVRTRFKDQNAIANAWFRTGLDAMLAPTNESFPGLPSNERLFLIIMRWFDALAAHRLVSVQMIRAKLHLPHPHYWAPLVFSLSRLVQWIREAALFDGQGRRRQVEEIGLTALFLATFAVWARDDTENQERTRRFLSRRLEFADRCLGGGLDRWSSRRNAP